MPDLHYTRGKLGAAVTKLAVGRGRIKERLANCALELAQVNKDVFSMPGIYREAPAYWERVWTAVTSAKTFDPKMGLYATSIDAMTEDEAADVAQAIVSLDSMLSTAGSDDE
jgi:hypothetical protein